MINPNSEVSPNVTVADCKAAMRVLEAIGNTVDAARGPGEILDALQLSYAFLNATVQHQERLNADFDNKPHGMGSL